MLKNINISLLVAFLSIGLATPMNAAIFRDVLDYGSNSSMIGIGKIEGFTPHAGVVLENSAAMNKSKQGASLYYFNGMGDTVTYLTGAFSYRLTPQFIVGLGIARESANGLDLTGESNEEAVSVGTFEYSNSTYVAGLGVELNEVLSVGATYYHYNKQIYTVVGNGGAFGVSALLDFKATDILFNVKNIGSSSVRYTQGDDEALLTEYVGAFRQSMPVFEGLSADVMGQVKAAQGLPTLKYAGIRVYPSDYPIMIGVGYQETRGLASQVSGGLAFGVELSMLGTTFSYAYQVSEYVGQTQEHHFSLSFGE